MLFVPFSFQNLIIAFILFRVFDIAKPLGIRKLEKIQNGWGVMLDDVLAGIYANIVLQIIIYFL
jgi:phosphatidylglycerophosphatase A